LNCPNCGTSNLDNASICANCGRPLNAPPPPKEPESQSYMPPPPPSPSSYTPPPPSSTSYTPPSSSSSYAPPYTPPGGPIPNYLIQSIFITLCCCLPLGVVAIIFAAQVNSKLAAGDIAGAREASSKAKLFCWIGLGVGLAFALIWMISGGAAVLQGINDGMANR